MFRYASIYAINSCRSLCTNSARNGITNCKSQLLKFSSNTLVLARSESTETFFNISNVYASSAPSGSDKVAVEYETLVDPALVYNVHEEAQFTIPEIPDALATPIQVVEKTVSALTANGEPTLQSLGLASNLPSGLVQQALEFLHCDVGLPWWGAIVAGSVALRLILLPLDVKLQQQMAKRKNIITPQIKAMQVEMTEAEQSGNTSKAAQCELDMKNYMLKTTVTPLKWIMQKWILLGSCFFGVRAMANLPVESMRTGGMLWFQDLTLADPLYILPVVTGATLFINMIEIKSKVAKLPTLPKDSPSVMQIAIPLALVYFTMDLPAAITCFWATSNVLVLGQLLLLRIPKVRTKLNI